MPKTYEQSEKFTIGCKAMGGMSVSDIAKESGMSREYVYQQKAQVEQYAQTLDSEKPNGIVLELDKAFKERTILSLALDCSASLEGIQRFFESVYRTHISIGYISGVLKKRRRKSSGI
jgi:coproporphyrinogen III oxidase-like Fe-S oxidoreductase